MIFFLVKDRRREAARWKASDASASLATEVTQAQFAIEPKHKLEFRWILKLLSNAGMPCYPFSDSEIRRSRGTEESD